MPSLRASFIAIGAAAVAGASCSLINSFDPVKPGNGGAGTGGQPTTSTSASSGTGGAGGSGSTGGGGTTSSAGGNGTGGMGGSVAKGLIVATGNVGATRVFATLDPSDGHQLKSITMNAAVVLYDEDTDLWYVFEGESIPPLPGSTMTLHAGRIDPTSGAWTDLHQLTPIPVIRDFQSFAILNHRIVYKAYDPDSDAGFGSPVGLAIIDTTAPTPKLGGTRGFVQVADFFGLIGTRANAIDGGTVNLIALEPCSAGMCQVDRIRVSFPSDPTQDPGVVSAPGAAIIPPAPNMFSISAAWTSRVKNGANDILVFPPLSGTLATIQPLNPTSSQALTPITFDSSGSNQFFSVAIAECEDVLLATEQANQALYAVSLTGGGATSAPTSSPAQVVAYEPITHTAVVPLHIPNVPLVGYTLTVTGGVPSLAQRNWSAPSSLNADNVTVRRLKQPSTQSCGN